MKDGDKLYCINTIIYQKTIYFIKNKSYIIDKIARNKEVIRMFSEENDPWYFEIYQQDLDTYRLNDFFMTNKEYRKEKLKKINETR